MSYTITIDSVEVVTGIDFFPAIEDSVEEEIEGSGQLDEWAL